MRSSVNRISCRSAVALSVLALGLAWSAPSAAAPSDDKAKEAANGAKPDADKPAGDAGAKGDAPPSTEAASAPAPTDSAPPSGTASVSASAGAGADLGAGADAGGEAPSLEHPATRAPGARRCGSENIPQ